DDKALEPHTGVHDQRHDEKKRDTVAQFVGPKRLRQKNIAKNQNEIKVRVGAVEPLLHKKDVKLVSAVEGHEKLEEVAVGDDEAGGEHDFGHVVKVPHSDEVFQAVGFAKRDGDGQHHRETGINGPGHKVRRKDGGVPTGNDGHGEVEADHHIDGEHQGRGQTGEEQVRGLVAVPVANGAAPAQRQHAVKDLLGFGGGVVAEGRQIRNEPHKPEEQGNGGVGRNRKDVPDERAAKLRPKPHRAGVREHVERHPRATGVNQREDAGAGNREERHRFGKTVDRSAPLLIQQEQNGGDERAGVADTDPPNEIHDGESPTD